jgi:glycosyltransferase involved in cell wall biosynthesis
MDFLLRQLADRAIAVSQAVKEFAIKGRCFPPDKINVVYNSVDMNRFKPIDPSMVKTFREKYKIPSHHRLIGTITRLRKEKGNRFLIHAIPIVLQQFPDTTFFIIGDGPLWDDLNQLAQTLKVQDHLIFTGFYQNIPQALAALDIKVLPSLTEGCPYALIEAMVAGKPIVATNVGGIAEMMVHGEDSLLVPPQDPEQLAEGIIRLLKNPSLAQQLGNEAKQRSRRFSVEQIVRQHEAIYEEVLSINQGT